jgi:nuclear transport factor 2 (NTF2) superfamily protein
MAGTAAILPASCWPRPPGCQWRNRVELPRGRAELEALLTRKWARELDYRLIKELWTFAGNRIAVRFAYEYRETAASSTAPMATKIGSSMPRG